MIPVTFKEVKVTGINTYIIFNRFTGLLSIYRLPPGGHTKLI